MIYISNEVKLRQSRGLTVFFSRFALFATTKLFVFDWVSTKQYICNIFILYDSHRRLMFSLFHVCDYSSSSLQSYSYPDTT